MRASKKAKQATTKEEETSNLRMSGIGHVIRLRAIPHVISRAEEASGGAGEMVDWHWRGQHQGRGGEYSQAKSKHREALEEGVVLRWMMEDPRERQKVRVVELVEIEG